MSAPNHEHDLKSEQALESLLAGVDSRPQPPNSHENLVRQVVHAEWRMATNQRVRRRYFYLSAAASLLLGIFVSVSYFGTGAATTSFEQVAQIQKQVGEITITDQIVETGPDSIVALAWVNGSSIRLGENTRLSISSVEEVYLHKGQLYYDSTPSDLAGERLGNGNIVRIRTDNGMVTPLGTRYMTRVANGEVTITVREGAVSLQGNRGVVTAAAGQRMTSRGSRRAAVSNLSGYGKEWDWIEKTSPPIDTKGRNVYEFLSWVSDETGRSVRFESTAAEELARSGLIVGFGRIELEPSVALQLIMVSSDLDWRIADGAIVVFRRTLTGQHVIS